MASTDKASRGEQLFALRQLQMPTIDNVSPGTLKAVLRCVDDHGSRCWASIATISHETNFTRRTVLRALSALLEFGYLTVDRKQGQTNTYSVNWEHIYQCHPGTSATLSPVPPCHQPVTSWHGGSATLAPDQCHPGTQSESKRDRSEKKRNTRRARRFSAPSLFEVQEFWKESSLKGTPEEFHDHYEANGWTQGRRSTPTKDWRAAARNWSRRQEQFARPAFGGKPRSANVGAGVVYQGDQSEDPNFGKF